jgi:hypothetical protein
MEPDDAGPAEPLRAELRKTEEELEQALDEACAAPPATEVDTGELIRVEEMLEVATDAAKRAVSLRRRRSVDEAGRGGRAGRQPREGQGVMADAEAAASPGAAHRTITDARGVRWDVFAVHPETRLSPHSQLRGTFSQGWLCYDSGTEKRRLSPIPENWQSLGDVELERLAEQAEVAPRRRTGRSGNEPGPTESRPPGG